MQGNMKRLFLLLLTVLFILTSCDAVEPDHCDGSVTNEISVNMETNVFIKVPNHTDQPNVRVVYWKVPCGEPKKGVFEYNAKAYTDYNDPDDKTAFAQFRNVSYNLRNFKDQIVVEVKITSGGYEEIKTYYYDYNELKDSDGGWHHSNFDFDWSEKWHPSS